MGLKKKVKLRDSIQLDNLFAIVRRFCCFAAYFLVFLLFFPRAHQYGWPAVNRTVILAIFLKIKEFYSKKYL